MAGRVLHWHMYLWPPTSVTEWTFSDTTNVLFFSVESLTLPSVTLNHSYTLEKQVRLQDSSNSFSRIAVGAVSPYVQIASAVKLLITNDLELLQESNKLSSGGKYYLSEIQLRVFNNWPCHWSYSMFRLRMHFKRGFFLCHTNILSKPRLKERDL